jgi:hypothetical protein
MSSQEVSYSDIEAYGPVTADGFQDRLLWGARCPSRQAPIGQ